MRKFWFTALMLLGLLGATVYAGGESSSATAPDIIRSVGIAIVSVWEFEGAVGKIVTQAGETVPNVVGFLTCLVLPLAWLGTWTLTNLPRILGLMALRDNVRSFFHD
jgi:hypothetical protein